jgi:hypothetical protein
VDPREKTRQQHETEKPKDLRKANENIRKSQGDDAVGPVDPKKAGNKPAFDRDR